MTFLKLFVWTNFRESNNLGHFAKLCYREMSNLLCRVASGKIQNLSDGQFKITYKWAKTFFEEYLEPLKKFRSEFFSQISFFCQILSRLIFVSAMFINFFGRTKFSEFRQKSLNTRKLIYLTLIWVCMCVCVCVC